MPKAPQRCQHGCPNLKGQCQEHKPKRVNWKDSKRKDSGFLDSAEWRRQKRRVVTRANKERGGCELRISDDCTGVAVQCDHMVPVWYTGEERVTDDELQGVCVPCHKKKSSFEGVQAKRIKKMRKNG